MYKQLSPKSTEKQQWQCTGNPDWPGW